MPYNQRKPHVIQTPWLRLLGVVVLLVSLGLLAACGKKAPDTGKTLASVNNETITERDYENYLRLRQTQQEPIVDKEKEKQVVLTEMIDRIVLSQYATENKLDQEPDNYLLMKRVRENILVQAAIRKLLKDNPVTDEDLKKRFQQEVEKTHKTEYKVRHILVKSEDEAKGLVAQIKKGGNFAALAKAKSLDVQTGRNGGDLGWINQGMVVPEFFEGRTGAQEGPKLGRAGQNRLWLPRHQDGRRPPAQDSELRGIHQRQARPRQPAPQDSG